MPESGLFLLEETELKLIEAIRRLISTYGGKIRSGSSFRSAWI